MNITELLNYEIFFEDYINQVDLNILQQDEYFECIESNYIRQ